MEALCLIFEKESLCAAALVGSRQSCAKRFLLQIGGFYVFSRRNGIKMENIKKSRSPLVQGRQK